MRNRELVLAGAGLLAMTIHSVDETIAFGAPSGPPWIVQLTITVVLLSLCAVHWRLGAFRLFPASALCLLGVVAVRTGWEAHVHPLLEHGAGATDVTGTLFVTGGLLLVTAGTLLLRRGVRGRTRIMRMHTLRA
jgi:hypothetical protein